MGPPTSVEDRVFAGEIVSLETPATLRLSQEARALVVEIFGDQPEQFDAADFRELVERARERLADHRWRPLMRDCLLSAGCSLSGLCLDTLRLRAIPPGLERIPEAAPVFFCHRDTWYGNPCSQLNAWIALQEVDERNSFAFYPLHFRKSILNDSEQFSTRRFEQEGGFGRVCPNHSVYPRALEPPAGEVWKVRARAGQMLLFSASHLHQTLPNQTEKVRFSLDFRAYHQIDRGAAPDPDNHSRGRLTYPPLEAT